MREKSEMIMIKKRERNRGWELLNGGKERLTVRKKMRERR